MILVSNVPLTKNQLETVEDIFRVAQCPLEVLKKTFPYEIKLAGAFLLFEDRRKLFTYPLAIDEPTPDE